MYLYFESQQNVLFWWFFLVCFAFKYKPLNLEYFFDIATNIAKKLLVSRDIIYVATVSKNSDNVLKVPEVNFEGEHWNFFCLPDYNQGNSIHMMNDHVKLFTFLV